MPTRPRAHDHGRKTPPRAVAAVALACLLCAACAESTHTANGPDWSLADRKPGALGSPAATGASPAPAPDQPQYEYKGGRDPVTGRAAIMDGAPPDGAADAAGSATAGSRSTGTRTVVVRKGDTLHGLSLTHHVSVAALKAANNLKSDTIVAGKKLVIPQS